MILDNIYKLPTDKVSTAKWRGDGIDYDLQLYNLLGELPHDTFYAINPDLEEIYNARLKYNINELPTTNKCIVLAYTDIWIVKIFKSGWIPAHGYEIINIFDHRVIWSKNPNIDILIDFENNPYGTFVPKIWDRYYRMTWYVDPRATPTDEKIWAFKCEPINCNSIGDKDMGYVMPLLDVVWHKNPDLDISIEFENDPRDIFIPDIWDRKHRLTWYVDPSATPTDDTVWAFKCEPINCNSIGDKDMGYVMPLLDVVWYKNPDLDISIEFENDPRDIFIPDIWDRKHRLTWYVDPSANPTDDTVWAVRCEPIGETPIVDKDMGYLMPILNRLDVIFISYYEKNAEENWHRVLEKAPYAKRVDGVTGIFEAHKLAADISDTDMFYVVDGDAWLVDEWEFNFQPSLFDRDCAYVWSSKNPINNLTYQYGGVKLFNKSILTKQKKWTTLDMFSTMPKIKAEDTISCSTNFNVDEFSAWRSAFRECVKLYKNNQIGKLDSWLQSDSKKPFGQYALIGARAACNYAQAHEHNQTALLKINDYKWLRTQFDNSN